MIYIYIDGTCIFDICYTNLLLIFNDPPVVELLVTCNNSLIPLVLELCMFLAPGVHVSSELQVCMCHQSSRCACVIRAHHFLHLLYFNLQIIFIIIYFLEMIVLKITVMLYHKT